MVEPTTALGGGLAILASKDLLNKLLGPTADYLGEGLKDLVAKSKANVAAIFSKATARLGDKLDQPGTVNPRVLKQVLDEGRFCEDELAAEYYGGILASARTESGRDDRGATYASLIRQLSTYQIRLHYLCYYCVRRLWLGKEFAAQVGYDSENLAVVISSGLYLSAMEHAETEDPKTVYAHSLIGLDGHRLIRPRFLPTPLTRVEKAVAGPSDYSIDFVPTWRGASLFMWATGHGDSPTTALFDPDVDIGEPLVPMGGDVSPAFVELWEKAK